MTSMRNETEASASVVRPRGALKRGAKRLLSGFAATAVVASSLVGAGAGAAQANPSTVDPLPNPAMADSCEMDLAITLDYSNSMTTSQLAAQENAVKDMASALLGYPVSVALFNFGSDSPISGSANAPLPLTSVETQAGVDAIHAKLDSFSRSGINYTNWQAAFNTVRTSLPSAESYDALVLVTDGNPTRISYPSVVQNTNDNPVNQAIVDGGVTAANELKAEGTRIIGVAVTDNLDTSGYDAMLRQIPQVTGPVEGSDYHLGGLSGLQQKLLDIVNENCAIINLDKVGTLSADGGTIDYDFTVSNDGEVTLTDIDLEDPLPGLSAITWGDWPNPAQPGVLQPEESVTATATYTVTQADREAGEVKNTATASGVPPSGGNPVEDEDPADVLIPDDPSISLTKTANPATYAAVGEEITYTFLVENDGDVPLTAVDVTDELPGLSEITFSNWPGAPGELQPGESVTGTATLTITQAHIDAGHIDNTATASGTPPTLPGGDTPDPVTDTDDETITGPAHVPGLTLVKTADRDAFEAAGEEITYRFTLENTGNVTLSDVTVTDALEGLSALTYTWPAGNADGVLQPGQSATASATYTTTQEDVDRGYVRNAATATGNPPGDPNNPDEPGDPVKTPPSEVTVPGPEQDARISLDKTGVLSVDENTVTYTFVATNTGNVTLSDVTINDPLEGLSAITLNWDEATAEGVLAPGESVTGTATYSVSQADRDAGSVINVADTVGTPPNAYDPEDPDGPGIPREPVTDEDPAAVSLEQTAAIHLLKEGTLDVSEPSQVGDVVEYTFTIINTGNVTLTDVEVSDDMLADAGVEITIEDSAWPGEIGVLAPGEQVSGTAAYPITQEDIDAGEIYNLAVATGVSPLDDPQNPGEKITPTDEDDVTLRPNTDPSLTLAKTGAFDGEAVAGDTVTYGFTVTNTGNQTLNDVVITDDMLADVGVGITFAADAWPAAEGVLAPGEQVTATAVYTLTQADIDAGHVYNSASVTGTPPTPPGGDTPPSLPPVEDDVDLPTPATPSIALVKSSELVGEAKAGNDIEYTFVATNTGNVTLSDVSIDDPLPGLSALAYDWSEATAEGVLAPGEQVTATAVYTLTQADIDAGHVDNIATTTGTPPNAYDPEDPDGPGVPQEPVTAEDPDVRILDAKSSISLVKEGVLDGVAAAGGTVTYTFTATNTGDTTLSEVSITDPLPGLSALVYDWSGATGEGVLAPGEQVTATATYTLTQADIDAGGVANIADTVGTPPNAYDPEDPDGPGIPQDPVTDEDPAFVPTPQGPAIQLVKTGAVQTDDTVQVGDLIEYTFVATNIGNVTLTDVVITDPLVGLSEISLDWSEATAEGTLAPGESVTATAVYTLTQADIDAGHVDNTAIASGLPPVDPQNPDDPRDPAEDEDDVTVPLPPAPSIEFIKTSELVDGAVAGDEVRYEFLGTNTGNVTLTDVVITDPLEGLSALDYEWPGEPGVLAPGEQVTATAMYTLTQADVDAGHVYNVAWTTGTPPTPPGGDTPPPLPPVEDDTDLPIPPAPSIELIKTSELLGEAAAGEEVAYTFVATNTGNVTLTEVWIDDPLPGLSPLVFDWSGATAEGILAPGEQVTATAVYILTQDDVDAGLVHNVATAIGVPPSTYDPQNPDTPLPQDPVRADDDENTPLLPAAAITLVKTGEAAGEALVGDEVEYTFVATNTGNVTLSDVLIADPLEGLSDLTYVWPGEVGVLAPGESTWATATYVLTDADVEAGSVLNTATVTGFAPAGDDPVGGQEVTDEDSVVVNTGKLAQTGHSLPTAALLGGLGILLLGAGLVAVSRSRRLTL